MKLICYSQRDVIDVYAHGANEKAYCDLSRETFVRNIDSTMRNLLDHFTSIKYGTLKELQNKEIHVRFVYNQCDVVSTLQQQIQLYITLKMTSSQSLTTRVFLYLVRSSLARVSVLEKTRPLDRSQHQWCAASLRSPLSRVLLLFLHSLKLNNSRAIPRCRPFSFESVWLMWQLTLAQSYTRRALIRWKQYHWQPIGDWAKVFLAVRLQKLDTSVLVSTKLRFMCAFCQPVFFFHSVPTVIVPTGALQWRRIRLRSS